MPREKAIRLIVSTGLAGLLLGGSVPAGAVVRPAGDSANQADGTAPWSQFGFNAADSSDNTKATAITTSNAASLAQAWQFKTRPPTESGQPKAGFDGSPVVAADPATGNPAVYFADGDGTLWAVAVRQPAPTMGRSGPSRPA